MGVVAKEVIPLWPDEAIKAQAVAARSFALYHLDHPQYEGFDIKATDQGQVYGGIEAEHPNTTKLVKATRGVTAVYDGEPIQAFFHSTSGGYTEAAVNVWGKDIPIFRPSRMMTRILPTTAGPRALRRLSSNGR